MKDRVSPVRRPGALIKTLSAAFDYLCGHLPTTNTCQRPGIRELVTSVVLVRRSIGSCLGYQTSPMPLQFTAPGYKSACYTAVFLERRLCCLVFAHSYGKSYSSTIEFWGQGCWDAYPRCKGETTAESMQREGPEPESYIRQSGQRTGSSNTDTEAAFP